MEINLHSSLCFSMCFTCIIFLRKKCTNFSSLEDENLTTFYFPCVFFIRETSNNAVGESISVCSSIIKILHYLLYLLFLQHMKANPRHVILRQDILIFIPKKCGISLYCQNVITPKHFKHLPLPQIKFGFCGVLS